MKHKLTAGQATVEYAILIGLAAMVSLGVSTAFRGIFADSMLRFSAELEKDLVSGGFVEADSMWEN